MTGSESTEPKHEPMPRNLEPMLGDSRPKVLPPDDDGWGFEIK